MTDQADEFVVDSSEKRRTFEELFLDEQRYILAALKRETECRKQQKREVEAQSRKPGGPSPADVKVDLYSEQIAGMGRTFGDAWRSVADPATKDPKGRVEAPPERAARGMIDENDGEPKAPANGDGGKPFDENRLRLVPARNKNEEPFVSFMADDQAGLAFSGGGIRSATFNLGLLQGLHDLGLLHMFDYLSTVSGGGYIGGWWTAWRHRGRHEVTDFFPLPAPTDHKPDPIKNREPEEIRHLREFSNFLTPRLGVFSTDMWNGVVSIISGMLPTLLMAACLLIVAIAGFICLGFLLLAPRFMNLGTVPLPVVPLLSMAIATACVLFGFERSWKKKFADTLSEPEFATAFHSQNATIATSVAAIMLASMLFALGLTLHPVGDRAEGSAAVAAYATLMRGPDVAGLPDPREVEIEPGVNLVIETERTKIPFRVNWVLLLPTAAWLLTSLVMLFYRYRASWSYDTAANRKLISASSRIMGRLGKAAVIWAMFVGIWELSRFLFGDIGTQTGLAMGGTLAVAAELFRRSTGLLTASATRSETPGYLNTIRSLLPQILAYLVLGTVLLLLCRVMGNLLERGLIWVIVAALISVLIVQMACWLVNPEALGLHAFYRDRLARAYLGASNPELRDGDGPTFAHKNRQTTPHERDDFRLRDTIAVQLDPRRRDSAEVPATPLRPFHLVCCAANDIATDHVADLGRGSRSATLSGLGLAIGDHAATQKHLGMATAQTASAAAFNSNMGSVTMKLGPVVTFLLAALNLRLGLWLRHPQSSLWNQQPGFPGRRLLKEMISATSAGFRGDNLQSDDVHLSDGAHFENLAMYELIRRHCRYIIVSDCGADPEVAFDDFGNALRRIREDFAVEIEIDLKPLVAGPDGLAQQHMAVGTIHYDRKNDKGILLYFKPNLSGDEPDDVKQYKTRNEQFPNETTSDQFYDESQWESYRRLGEHAARSSLRFCENYRDETARTAQQVFCDAFQKYYPTPEDLPGAVTIHTERFASFQQKLRTEGGKPPRLVMEICPELQAFPPNEPAPSDIPQQEELTRVMILLTEMTQTMEDAFNGCHLATHSNHPLNLGWINLFQRWANAPTFRSWWPILQPLYGADFRRFMNRDMGLSDRAPGEMKVSEVRRFIKRCSRQDDPQTVDGMAYRQLKRERMRANRRANLPDWDMAFRFDLPIWDQNDSSAAAISPSEMPTVQVAVCLVKLTGNVAQWTPDDLYVPPGLWGTGIGTVFLKAICAELQNMRHDGQPIETCRVSGEESSSTELQLDEMNREQQELQESNQGARASHTAMLRFYTAVGFKLQIEQHEGGEPRQVLTRDLAAM